MNIQSILCTIYKADHTLFYNRRHKDVFTPEGFGKHCLVKKASNFKSHFRSGADTHVEGLPATTETLHQVRGKLRALESLLEDKQLRDGGPSPANQFTVS